MLLPHTVVNPLARVEIRRFLEKPGEVLVQAGDQVEPFQIVAQAQQPPDFHIVNASRILGLPPKKVRAALKVEVGQQVSAGDVLASRGGLGGRVCRAPFDGLITGYGRGRLLLEAPAEQLQIDALVPGTVVQVWPGRGVLIETQGGYIQAAWGNGKEAFGVLRVVVRRPRHPLRARRLDASAQGAIVVAGSGLDEEALEQAIEMQVQGIILGGVPVSLLPRLQEVDFPIIATEGVGSITMSKAAFKLLNSLDGREAAISGRLESRWNRNRPFVVVPMPSEMGAPINPEVPLEVGSRVRALRRPYLGMSGTVTDMPPGTVSLETGARVHGVFVDFDGDEVFVPYANLELLL